MLPKVHQDIVQRFMSIDVQYIIHLDVEAGDHSLYVKYMNFLGKKLYICDTMSQFVQGLEIILLIIRNAYKIFHKEWTETF